MELSKREGVAVSSSSSSEFAMAAAKAFASPPCPSPSPQSSQSRSEGPSSLLMPEDDDGESSSGMVVFRKGAREREGREKRGKRNGFLLLEQSNGSSSKFSSLNSRLIVFVRR